MDHPWLKALMGQQQQQQQQQQENGGHVPRGALAAAAAAAGRTAAAAAAADLEDLTDASPFVRHVQQQAHAMQPNPQQQQQQGGAHEMLDGLSSLNSLLPLLSSQGIRSTLSFLQSLQ
jgi:3-oxoacyl-ACP reductase-like protein